MKVTESGLWWQTALKIVRAPGFSNEPRGYEAGLRQWRTLLTPQQRDKAEFMFVSDLLARACAAHRASLALPPAPDPRVVTATAEDVPDTGSTLVVTTATPGYDDPHRQPPELVNARTAAPPPAPRETQPPSPPVLAGVTDLDKRQASGDPDRDESDGSGSRAPEPAPAKPETAKAPVVPQESMRVAAWQRIPKLAEMVDVAGTGKPRGAVAYAEWFQVEDARAASGRRIEADRAFQEERIAGREQANAEDRVAIARGEQRYRALQAEIAEVQHIRAVLRAYKADTLADLPAEALESLGITAQAGVAA